MRAAAAAVVKLVDQEAMAAVAMARVSLGSRVGGLPVALPVGAVGVVALVVWMAGLAGPAEALMATANRW